MVSTADYTSTLMETTSSWTGAYRSPCVPETSQDEYQYYRDYVATRATRYQKSTCIRFLTLNTTIYRMLELILEKFHDIDARNSTAGNIIFHAVAFGQTAGFNIKLEDNHGTDARQPCKDTFASELCLIAKELSSAFLQYNKQPWSYSARHHIIFELQELVETAFSLALAPTLHHLLSINIQKRGDEDRILTERFIHMQNMPFMRDELEKNSVFPLLYHIPKAREPEFLKLLRDSGISLSNGFVTLEEVVNKIYRHARKLVESGAKSKEGVLKMLQKTLLYHTSKINLEDERSFLWPLSRCLVLEPYENIWNHRYPHMNFLVESFVPKAMPTSLGFYNQKQDVLDICLPQEWDIPPVWDMHKNVEATYEISTWKPQSMLTED